MEQKNLIIYGDTGSQPCRAVFAFCKLNNILYEFKQVRLGKQEHLTPEMKKLNPAQTLPAMEEIDLKTNEKFFLFESHAILRYLATTRQVPDHWYPKNPIQRAKVDQYLDWHHTFLRQGLGWYIYKKLFIPFVQGRTASEDEIIFQGAYQKRSLDIMERWLTENPYLCGDQISIADLSAACELIQGLIIDLNLDKWPKVKAWQQKIIYDNPVIKEIHHDMFKFADLSVKRQKQSAKL